MRMRKHIIIALLSLPVYCQAQRTLFITPVTQHDPLWCWSASMEMIMLNKFPSDLQTQCQIVDFYDSRNCTCPSDCVQPSSNCSATAEESDVEALFEDPTYSLKKKVSVARTLKWTRVKSEIEGNNLFMIGINYYSNTNKCATTHFVVANGYTEGSDSGDGSGQLLNFMTVTDPKDNCVGIGILEVRHLPPTGDSTAKHCRFIYNFKNDGGHDDGRLISQIRAITFSACESSLKKKLSDSEMRALIVSGNYQRVPVNYYSIMKNGKIDSSKKVVDMISTESCGKKNLVTRMQFFKDKWEPLLVLQQNDNASIPLIFNGESIVLSNDKDLIDFGVKKYPYEKVILPPSPYEFYRFKDSNGKIQYSLAHVDVAKIGNEIIRKGVFLSNKNILDLMKGLPQRNLVPTQGRLNPTKNIINNKKN